MNIGTVSISGRFVLAPMAAVNCTAFRMLCKENKASLVYTQMIDVDFIKNRNKRETGEFLNINEYERPVAVQLIVNDEESLIKSTRLVEDLADIIDFNVGCSRKEFLERGYGAHLLCDLPLLEKLVRSMVEATDKPVTVKIRIGWDEQSINAVKVSKILESARAKAICIHGRTAQQRLSKKVNWTIMKQVKERLRVPVMANGDVKSYDQGLSLLDRTRCDFVMIGKSARNCPWIFDREKSGIDNEGIKTRIFRFIELYDEYERRTSSQELREHAFWMLKDFRTNQDTRAILKLKTTKAIENFVRSLR